VTIITTVGGALRGVVETIHSPTYMGESQTLTTMSDLETDPFRVVMDEVWAEMVADRTRDALDLIDRLTAGDVCDHCGAKGCDLRRGSYTRGCYDDTLMCEECHAQARMEE
jgi:hypothetical protein